MTNTLVPVKWGVEAVWAILTPKQTSQSSKIKRIACAAIYSKPGSNSKTDLLDHISEAFNIVSTKFGEGVHFIIDTNELRLKPIMNLSPTFVQIVTKPTRHDKTTGKKTMLEPIIMTLSKYYQSPVILSPLDADPDTNGKQSDHNIVVCRPVSVINNVNARFTRKVEVQPITDSGIWKMTEWLMIEDWSDVTKAKTSNQKADFFQELFKNKFDDFFPKRTLKISNNDQPWMTQKLNKLDRQRKRTYHKQRRSLKWKKLEKQFKIEMKQAKTNFYTKMVADLKEKEPSKWYKAVKRMTSYENKEEQLTVDKISHLTDQE